MRAILDLPHRATYADYLAAEQTSECRHEFLDGVIVGMAGGSEEHSALGARVTIAIGSRLSDDCRYLTSDQRVWIATRTHARYSDGMVICGPSERVPHDRDAITNPTIIIEVLSPSSAGTDDGAKRREYQSLASLQAYVIAAQDERAIRIYLRGRDGWATNVYRHGDLFELPCVNGPIAVAEIYDRILDISGRSLLR